MHLSFQSLTDAVRRFFRRPVRAVLFVMAVALLFLAWLLIPPSPSLTEFKVGTVSNTGWTSVLNHPVDLNVQVLRVGTIQMDRNSLLQQGPEDWPERYAALAVKAYVFEHPNYGLFAIDAGFHHSFADQNEGNYNGLMRVMVKLSNIENSLTTPALDALIPVNALKGMFLTHLHPDHTSGIESFPADMPVIADVREYDWLGKLINTDLLEKHRHWQYLSFEHAASIAPFNEVLDVFGDGSVWALSTKGHSAGHVSYLLNDTKGAMLVTGDASHFGFGFHQRLAPAAPGETNKQFARQSLNALVSFAEQFPQVRIELGHE